MDKKANIAFWGPDVAQITSLVYALKPGEHAPHQPSIHPFSEVVSIDDSVSVTATVPSANQGARLAWRSSLPDFDGIVYVVDAAGPSQLALSKEELNSLIHDETLSKPILVLAPKSSDESNETLSRDLNLGEFIAKEDGRVALFVYDSHEDSKKGIQWLLQHV